MKRELKLLNFFNKRNNQNRKRSSGRKRRIFASAVLAGNLLFGNFKSNDLKTNQTPLSNQKVISNQEFNSLDGSQNRNANNKREIIKQLNQLPIHNQYELHFKNGKIRMVDKLTPLLIGKTKIMHFYEKL